MMPAMKWTHLASAGKSSIGSPPSDEETADGVTQDRRQDEAGDDRAPKGVERIFHRESPVNGRATVCVRSILASARGYSHGDRVAGTGIDIGHRTATSNRLCRRRRDAQLLKVPPEDAVNAE